MPTCIAASARTACSRPLPDRMISGRSADRLRSRSACATARVCRQGVGVGEVLPRAAGIASGKKRSIRRMLRPVLEAVGDAGGVRPERDGTSRVDGAVAPLGQHRRQRNDIGHGSPRRVLRPAATGAPAERVGVRGTKDPGLVTIRIHHDSHRSADRHVDALEWRASRRTAAPPFRVPEPARRS